MMPSPPDSHPHSPAARPFASGSTDEPPPPVPPLPPHLLALQPPSASCPPSRRPCSAHTPRSNLHSSSSAVALDGDQASWESYALTPDTSVDSLDGARSGRGGGFTSADASSSSSSSSSPRSPDASTDPRCRGIGGRFEEASEEPPREEAVAGGSEAHQQLLASPFLGAADMLTPPLERSEDEVDFRSRGLGVDIGLQPPERATLSRFCGDSAPAGEGTTSIPLSPPSSDAPRQSYTTPPSPRTPPTPFLRTVSSRTFISTTTTTTTTTAAAPSAHSRETISSTPLLPSAFIATSPSYGDRPEEGARPRTVSTSVLEGESPRKRISRPASVRDWQSDDDDDFEHGPIANRSGNSRRHHHRQHRATPTGSSYSPSSAFLSQDAPLSSSFHASSGGGSGRASFRAHKYKPTRSAPDSRTNLVGMLSAALNMSPSTAIATLSSSAGQPPTSSSASTLGVSEDSTALPSSIGGGGASTSRSLALTGPLPALSKAITAPIAPLAHVFAFVLISLAAAVALSTVLVGSYGLTAWDVTRLRVRDARSTIEDGRRRIGASVERGRKLIEGAVDGARELAEGLVDSASAGLEDGGGGDFGGNRHERNRTASGQSSSSSAGSSPRNARHSVTPPARQPRSSLVGSAATSVDELLGSLTEAFWKVMKRMIPAATVKRVLEAAEIRLGKRPPPPRETKARRQQRYGSAQARHSAPRSANAAGGASGASARARRRTTTDESTTSRQQSSAEPTAHPSPSVAGDSRFMFSGSGASSSTTRSPHLGESAPSSDDESAQQQPPPKRTSSLPPRPPLSVLLPSILLTLVIAFGAMAYNLLKKRKLPRSSTSTAFTSSPSDADGSASPWVADPTPKTKRNRHT